MDVGRLLAPRQVPRMLLRIVAFAALFLVLAAVLGGGTARLAAAMQAPQGLAATSLVSGAGLVSALVAGWALLAVLDRRRPGALGFAWTRKTPAELGIGLAVGAGALAVAVAVLAVAGAVAWTADRGTVGGYALELLRDLLLFGVAAASEEAIFRGYAFQALVDGLGPVWATLLASGGFALAHRNNPSVDAVALVNIFLAGIMLSAAYLRTRSLTFATAVHLGWNWMMATVFALPVSGLVLVDTPLYDARVGPPTWLSGGAFGPEGGLVGAIGFLVAMAAVLWLPGLAEARRMRELAPLVDSRL